MFTKLIPSRANWRGLLTGVVMVGIGVSSASLYGQDTSMSLSEETPKIKKFAVEIQPLTTALAASPNTGAIGGSAEFYLGDKWATFVEGSYIDATLKNSWIADLREDTNAPLPRGGEAYSAGLGLRYYEDPIGDSLYGGGSMSYGETDASWTFEDAEISSELYSVTTSAVAGYRWVWNNGLLVRLGAGAGLRSIAAESYKSTNNGSSTDQAIAKVKDLQNFPVAARVDLGLGYTF